MPSGSLVLFPEDLRDLSLSPEEDFAAAPFALDDEPELFVAAFDEAEDDLPLLERLPEDPLFWDCDELFEDPLPLEDFVLVEFEDDEGAGVEAAGAAAAGSGELDGVEAGGVCEEFDPEFEPLPASTFSRPSLPPTVTLSAPAVLAPPIVKTAIRRVSASPLSAR